MRHKGLNQELAEDTLDMLNLLCLASTLSDPRLRLGPCLVESEKTALSTALDQLIGLRNELGIRLEEPRVCDLSLVKNGRDVLVLGKVKRGESRRGVVLGRGRESAGLDHRGASEVVVDDGLAIGLENAFRRHDVSCVVVPFVFCFLRVCSGQLCGPVKVKEEDDDDDGGGKRIECEGLLT